MSISEDNVEAKDVGINVVLEGGEKNSEGSDLMTVPQGSLRGVVKPGVWEVGVAMSVGRVGAEEREAVLGKEEVRGRVELRDKEGGEWRCVGPYDVGGDGERDL